MDEKANFCLNCGMSAGKPGVQPVATSKAEKRLMRPREDKWIAGVCSAFARYFELDITLVRLIWLLTIVIAGTGILVYLICWLVIPLEPLAMDGSTRPQVYSA